MKSISVLLLQLNKVNNSQVIGFKHEHEEEAVGWY